VHVGPGEKQEPDNGLVAVFGCFDQRCALVLWRATSAEHRTTRRCHTALWNASGCAPACSNRATSSTLPADASLKRSWFLLAVAIRPEPPLGMPLGTVDTDVPSENEKEKPDDSSAKRKKKHNNNIYFIHIHHSSRDHAFLGKM
jgi:hypothetical protein